MQSNNASSSAKNITNLILDNIRDSDLRLTSGTLIELVRVGPKLSGLWNMPNTSSLEAMEDRVNFSVSILRDQLEISSNLYQQHYAWLEMNSSTSTSHATELIRTNEQIAFRHLEAVIHECGLEERHFPYNFSLSDSNNLTRVSVAALADIAEINLHNVLLPDLPTQADSATQNQRSGHRLLYIKTLLPQEKALGRGHLGPEVGYLHCISDLCPDL